MECLDRFPRFLQRPPHPPDLLFQSRDLLMAQVRVRGHVGQDRRELGDLPRLLGEGNQRDVFPRISVMGGKVSPETLGLLPRAHSTTASIGAATWVLPSGRNVKNVAG